MVNSLLIKHEPKTGQRVHEVHNQYNSHEIWSVCFHESYMLYPIQNDSKVQETVDADPVGNLRVVLLHRELHLQLVGGARAGIIP